MHGAAVHLPLIAIDMGQALAKNQIVALLQGIYIGFARFNGLFPDQGERLHAQTISLGFCMEMTMYKGCLSQPITILRGLCDAQRVSFRVPMSVT